VRALTGLAGDIALALTQMLDRRFLGVLFRGVVLAVVCVFVAGASWTAVGRQGKNLPDIVKGVYYSMIKRVLEMDALTEKVVMTGGVVAHNPFMVKMTEEMIDREILVPDYPQHTGAIGAALYAMGS
jgi:activator of 2-hydroxyglutaryl-CoA dehydratase